VTEHTAARDPGVARSVRRDADRSQRCTATTTATYRPADRAINDKEGTDVKTMTCRQLSGPCDFQHHGETADAVIKAQDRHLKDAVAAGDIAHQPAREAMKGRWRHPKQSMDWYRDVKRAFAELPTN
jgi:hypothetical protein